MLLDILGILAGALLLIGIAMVALGPVVMLVAGTIMAIRHWKDP